MTNSINPFKEIVDNAWIKHSKDQFHALTAQDMEIMIQTCLMPLAIKTQNDSFLFVHVLKQEMHADIKYVESLEKELESDKAEFSNMYNVILQKCMSNDVKCSYLMSLSDLDTLDELQCLYIHKVKECDCLAQKLSKQTESVSKEVHSELLKRFYKVEKHSISLEIALQKCKEQRTVNVAGARENVGSLVVQRFGIQCFNCKEFGYFAKECRKSKRVKDFAYHKEMMLLCKQAEQVVPLQAEQYDWLADTDEEIDEQELEAHYSYMAKIQEVPTADSGTDFEPLEPVQNEVGYNVFANDL
nr:hypothetical protein [Tanacetum cinerariifolium]